MRQEYEKTLQPFWSKEKKLGGYDALQIHNGCKITLWRQKMRGHNAIADRGVSNRCVKVSRVLNTLITPLAEVRRCIIILRTGKNQLVPVGFRDTISGSSSINSGKFERAMNKLASWSKVTH